MGRNPPKKWLILGHKRSQSQPKISLASEAGCVCLKVRRWLLLGATASAVLAKFSGGHKLLWRQLWLKTLVQAIGQSQVKIDTVR